jgi:hypothetical protein
VASGGIALYARRPLRGKVVAFFVIWLSAAAIYVAVSGPRILRRTENNHFVRLAESLLAGRLDLLDATPPGSNDWACFDSDDARATERIERAARRGERLTPIEERRCDDSAFRTHRDGERWYVSFPPFPALVILPAVAIWGTDMHDALFWAIVAGLSPAVLYLLLRRLAELRRSRRSPGEDRILVALFALGTVYFYVAVQGEVWFAGHVVASILLPLYLLASLEGRHPIAAGLALGALFLTRPTTMPFGLFFLAEAIIALRAPEIVLPSARFTGLLGRFTAALAATDRKKLALKVALFAVPVLLVGFGAMAMNQERFANAFEFGHSYLLIASRGRIETWGLFDYHYVARNASVFFAGLPWITPHGYFRIGGHGLALWLTTPALLLVLWPRQRLDLGMKILALCTLLVCAWNLAYQNSGWLQFGYRFSLDYMAGLFVLLAVGGRSVRSLPFIAAMIFAIAVNLFGAITFNRAPQFYDDDASQTRVFEPD